MTDPLHFDLAVETYDFIAKQKYPRERYFLELFEATWIITMRIEHFDPKLYVVRAIVEERLYKGCYDGAVKYIRERLQNKEITAFMMYAD
jgi:hypothetical protein